MGNEKWLTGVPAAMLVLVIVYIVHQNWRRIPYFLALSGAPALLLASLAVLGGHLFALALRQAAVDARTVAIETGVQPWGRDPCHRDDSRQPGHDDRAGDVWPFDVFADNGLCHQDTPQPVTSLVVLSRMRCTGQVYVSAEPERGR